MVPKWNIPLIFLAMSAFFPSISLKYFLAIPYEAYIFKSIGMIFLIISVIIMSSMNFKIQKRTFPLILCFGAIHFFAMISEIINSTEYGIIVILRLISIILFCAILLNLDKKSLTCLYQICSGIVVFLILISIILFVSGGQYGEVFPLLGIYANSSLIFEVNMYGVLCYTLFFSTLVINLSATTYKKMWIFCLSIFGVFISFYRTVWILFIVAFFLRYKILAALLITTLILLITSDFERYSNAFKFDQLATLTGRDVLWSAALNTFQNNPFLGGGEANISKYIHEYRTLPWDMHSYHSVVFDVIGISGALGIIGLCLYLVAIISMLRSTKKFVLFLILYMPAFLNTYYLFAPNAVAFYCTVTFLLLCKMNSSDKQNGA